MWPGVSSGGHRFECQATLIAAKCHGAKLAGPPTGPAVVTGSEAHIQEKLLEILKPRA
jgi:hypothetical protein